MQQFGTTLKETSAALEGFHFGKKKQPENSIKAIGRIIVTCLMIFLATYLYATKHDNAAAGITGVILGYWLK